MRTASLPPNAIACAAFAAGAIALALFGFGPLDPPNGPITSTYKTMSDVEPRIAINQDNTPGDAGAVFKITAAGSYYLTDSFPVPSGKVGILIEQSNVTVDLNGFRINGQPGSSDGIRAFTVSGITIRNGVVSKLRGSGIALTPASASRIEGVTVIDCTVYGIGVGAGSEVARCTVDSNGGLGIRTDEACIVSACIARGNGSTGISVGDDAIVRDCIATGNAASGISGGDGCTISGCTASSNTYDGISAANASVISSCTGRLNGIEGIAVNSSAVVQGCAVRGNTGNGIAAQLGSTITGCTSAVNQTGIQAGKAAFVSGCNAYANGADGITFSSNSDIRANHASNNASGAGLRALGNNNRVDENHSVSNAIGIALDGLENWVSRNNLHINDVPFTGDSDDFTELYQDKNLYWWDNLP